MKKNQFYDFSLILNRSHQNSEENSLAPSLAKILTPKKDDTH